MSEIDEIMHSEMLQDKHQDGQGGLPHWAKRYLIALGISIFLIVVIKPQAVTEIKYDVKTGQCSIQTVWSKVLLYSLVLSGVMYFMLKKYY